MSKNQKINKNTRNDKHTDDVEKNGIPMRDSTTKKLETELLLMTIDSQEEEESKRFDIAEKVPKTNNSCSKNDSVTKTKQKLRMAPALYIPRNMKGGVEKLKFKGLRLAPSKHYDEINHSNSNVRNNKNVSSHSTKANSKTEKSKLRLAPALQLQYQNRSKGESDKMKFGGGLRLAPPTSTDLEHSSSIDEQPSNEEVSQNENSQIFPGAYSVLSSQPTNAYPKSDEIKLQLASTSYIIQTRSKEKNNNMKFGGGLRLAPPASADLEQLSSNDNQHLNEGVFQDENNQIFPGAYAVSGIGTTNNDDSIEEILIPETTRSDNSHLLPSSQDIIVADVVDNDADRAQIIDDFIAGTTQAKVYKPLWKRRYFWPKMLGLLFFVAIGILVLSFVLKVSEDEKLFKVLGRVSGKNMLLKENSPQYKAFQWLLSDEMYLRNSMTDLFVRERYIAAVLYLSTGGEFWEETFQFLNNQKSVCEWNDGNTTGIMCNESQMIVSISAVQNNLIGTLPSEISGLSFLETIILDQNILSGTIPSTFGVLDRLQKLKLSSNSFTGTIPNRIFDLRNLNTLNLSNNSLTGTLRDDFTKLSSLEVLYLDDNLLSGFIPSKFAPISRIKQFSLGSNKFTGPIPQSINLLGPTLEILQLAANNINMTIPSSIESCQRLEKISLDSNMLSGSIPTEIGLLRDLETISIKNNTLTGRIPSELGNISRFGRLRLVELSKNKLSGEIPPELGSLKSVVVFRFQQNELTGTLPTQILTLPTLAQLSVHRNNIRGSINDCGTLEIAADCDEPEPEIICECCRCYNDNKALEDFDPLEEVLCNRTAKQVIEENLIKGSRGEVSCSCADSFLHVRCDESCISCNIDETICVENINFQLWIKQPTSIFPDRFQNEVKYIKGGRNDTIVWGSTGWEQNIIDSCWVRINGVECKSCAVKQCLNQKNAPFVSCSNIAGVGDYDGCDGTQAGRAGIFEAIFLSTTKSFVNKAYCPVLDPLNIWHNFL